MTDNQNPTTLRLLGGELCLDFANGLKAGVGDHRSGYLANYADLVRWAQLAGGPISEEGANRLLLEAESRPREAVASFEKAVALRGTLYRIFSAVAREANPDPADLELLSTVHMGTLEHYHITDTEDGFGWVRVEGTDELEEPLWPVVLSATSLLTSGQLDRVKACPPEVGGCGWLFRDASKNKSRRWCAMGECGSRVNMRRLYARKRAGKTEGGREDPS